MIIIFLISCESNITGILYYPSMNFIATHVHLCVRTPAFSDMGFQWELLADALLPSHAKKLCVCVFECKKPHAVEMTTQGSILQGQTTVAAVLKCGGKCDNTHTHTHTQTHKWGGKYSQGQILALCAMLLKISVPSLTSQDGPLMTIPYTVFSHYPLMVSVKAVARDQNSPILVWLRSLHNPTEKKRGWGDTKKR